MIDKNTQELIRGFLDDELNQEELATLMEEWKKEGGVPEFETAMDRALKSGAYAGKTDANRATIIFDRVLQTIQQKKVGRRIPFYRPVAAAALILLLAGAGFWVYRYNLKTQTYDQPVLTHNDIAPGHNGAILTLSGGSRVVLDTTNNGQIATQGTTAIIKKIGQLSYSAKTQKENEIFYNTLATPRARQYQLTLSDGTKVWLNAASSIRYPTAFTGSERRVEITGEVYFEVTENKAKPFHVKFYSPLGVGGDIQVLGTHFNINAYGDEPILKTTLLEGSVKVAKDKAAVFLKPGQQAQLDKAGTITIKKDADLEETIAWKEGYFKYSGTDIQTLLRQAARWYDIEIAYAGKIPSDHFTGKISRTVNLSEWLKVLEYSEIKFKIEGKKLTVIPTVIP